VNLVRIGWPHRRDALNDQLVAGLRGKPGWVTVLTALALGVGVGGFNEALRGLLGLRWNWVVFAVYVLGWSVAMPALWWLIWRAVDRGDLRSPAKRDRDLRSEAVSQAITAGALPPDANLDLWQQALANEVREMNSFRWFAAGLAVAIAGLIGVAAAVANDNAWTVWAVAVFIAGAGLAAFLWWAGQIRIARQLLAQTAVG
jgi:hypothetical protein